MGPAVGAKSIIVRTGFGEREIGKIQSTGSSPGADYIAEGIKDAVDWIVRDSANQEYDR